MTVSIAIYIYTYIQVFSKKAQNEGDMMQMMHVRQMKKV